MHNILITGGSGLVGTHLTNFLLQKGYTVSHLGRKPKTNGPVITYRWDYKTGEFDENALNGTEFIINLAGANVAGKRWTKSYKEEIYNSRVLSTRLLFEAVKKHGAPVKKVISASATGYYGNKPYPVNEDSPAGNDFLSEVCADWEAEAHKFSALNIPQTILRFGVVLAPDGGFVTEMAKPIKMGVGAILGNGRQTISWIHIDDLCNIVLKSITEEGFTGPYNCVTPTPTTNAQVTKLMAKLLHKPLWLPHAPAFALKIILGEMSYELLVNHSATPQRLLDAGYIYQYPNLVEALKNTLKINS